MQLSLCVFCFCALLCYSAGQKVATNVQNLHHETEIKEDFPDRPLQIVKPDNEHKRLVIVNENLQHIKRIEGSVATVAVVGKFHSGKSFLMNQLMTKSSGFGIGPSVQPMTMGIWIWGKPAEFTLGSGEKVHILFLDTEGFAANNISENYDAKIFAVATLLSSYLLYNSVKIIDQADIDYLELLARRTQLFALRSQMSRSKWTNEVNKDLLSFPPLIWVVQDFAQETINGETPTQWLHRLMTTHSRENDLYEISLLDIFKSVDCHTLFLPAVKKRLLTDLSLAKEEDLTEEYKQERAQLIRKLKKEIVPKRKNQRPISGPELSALIEILVKAANDGSLADVPNRWDAFVNRLQQTATEDCLKFYETEMNVLLMEEYRNEPINERILNDWHLQTMEKATDLLEQLLHGLEEPLKKGLTKLQYSVAMSYTKTKDINEKKIKLKCSSVIEDLTLKSEIEFGQIEFPVVSSIFYLRAKDIRDTMVELCKTQLGPLISKEVLNSYVDSLTKLINNQAASAQLENNRRIEEFLMKVISECTENFVSIVNADYSNTEPRKPKFLEKAVIAADKQVKEYFEERSGNFTQEKFYQTHLLLLQETLNKKVDEISKENARLVLIYLDTNKNKFIEQFRLKTSSNYISLPVNTSDLENRLKRESEAVFRDFDHFLGDFESYPIYSTVKDELKDSMFFLADQRHKENIDAFQREVSITLDTAKKLILLSQDKYSTVFSFKRFMYQVCLLQLNEGKPKYWSTQMKTDVIYNFISKDKELDELVKSKESLMSSIVGFFQWILWLLNLN